MEGRKPLNLEGLSSMMKRMEEEEESCSPDLEIVRPDKNQGCTSTSYSSSPPPSPPSGIEKIDLASLSIFQLEDKIRDYRNMKLPLKDGGVKIQRHISLLEKELATRRSQTQTGIDLEANKKMPPLPNPKPVKGKQDVFDVEIRPSSPEQGVSRCFVDKGCPLIALECDKDEVLPLSAQTPERGLDGVRELERSPCSRAAKVCVKCHQSVSNGTFQRKGTDGIVCCSSCKKKPVSSPANGPSVNGMRDGVCTISRAEKSPGSAKRSQQAVGGTFDTAVELSDDEELGEGVIGESSSSNLSMRKRLRSASKKLAGAKFLYPPSGDPEAVEVRAADLDHLAPFEFLNDTVIDFYVKYMQLNVVEKDRLERFHFFSCFFYKKLTSAKKARGKDWFEEVHKWTKGINIFKKSYLFIPIHDSCHWSLAIVCFLAGQKQSYVLHLDSLASSGHQSRVIFNVLKSYLLAEQKHLTPQNDNVEDVTTVLSKPTCKRIAVPLQDNEWDCGLFMLYYIQKFVAEVHLNSLDDMFGRNWFKPNEASELRGTIFSILVSILEQEVT